MDADRLHVALDLVLICGLFVVALACIIGTGRRRTPAAACVLAGALAGAAALLWILAVLSAGRSEDADITCPAIERAMTSPGNASGGGWHPRGWSWSEWGLAYAVSTPNGGWTRVVCRVGL